MGVQILRGVYSEGLPAGAVWATAGAPWGSVPPVGAVEGESGRGGTFAGRSRVHHAVDSGEVRGIAGGGLHQGKERDPSGTGVAA